MTKTFLACCVLLVWLATWPAATSAQTWSPQQQEIIDQVKRCNDGWVDSIAQKRFEAFDSVCPETVNAVVWYPAAEAPAAYGGAGGAWSASSSANRSVSWRDLQPITVQVEGDVAFIYYLVTWTPVSNTGETRSSPSRRLTVFQRRGGRWLMAGGTVAATSAP